MDHFPNSRRIALKQLVSLSAVGALALLRSGKAGAAAPAAVPAAGIPGVVGPITSRSDASYESLRQALVWHRSKPNRFPDMSVPVRSGAEVASVIKFAAQNKLKIAIRTGGHNPTGASLRDGGICLDLSGLTDIQVDKQRQIASVRTGVRAIQINSRLTEGDLTFPTAYSGTVRMADFCHRARSGGQRTRRIGSAAL